MNKNMSKYKKRVKTLYVNNGVINKRIRESDLFNFLNDNKNFVIGYKKFINKISVTNGIINKYINSDEVDKFLCENKDFKVGTRTKGYITITNGSYDKLIDPNELDKYPEFKVGTCYKKVWATDGNKSVYVTDRNKIPDGFIVGKSTLKNSNKGRLRINNGERNKYIHPDELNDYLNKGWDIGSIASERLIESSRINFSKRGNLGYSRISSELFDSISLKLPNINLLYSDNEERINTGRSNFDIKTFRYPDLLYPERKKIIEFQGVYWHNRMDYFNNESIRNDFYKYQSLVNLGYKILYVWEDKYNEDKQSVINDCIEFLTNDSHLGTKLSEWDSVNRTNYPGLSADLYGLDDIDYSYLITNKNE